MTLVATLAEFKDWLKYGTDTANDTKLTTALTAASQWVEWRIGGPLTVTSFTEHVKTVGNWITPANRPIQSVTSITPDLGSAYSATWYTIDGSRNAIYSYYGWYSGYATLVYTAGLTAILERHKIAGMEVGRHLWTIQNGSSARGYPGDDLIPTPMGFAIPRRAEEMLAPDVIPAIA